MKKTIDQTLQQAIILHQESKLEEARIFYRKILKIEPNHAVANHNLGSIELNMNNTEVAKSFFKKAIKTNPNFADAYSNLGVALKKLSRPEEAELNYKKAIELRPDFFSAYFNLANLFNNEKKLPEAEFNYKKVIELKPDHIEAYLNLGFILQESFKVIQKSKNKGMINSTKLIEAEKVYKKVIKLKPNKAEIYNNLGNVLTELGKIKEAELNYKKAIELNPKLLGAHDNLGILLINLGKVNESEACFKRSLSINPHSVVSNNGLASVLKKKILLSSINKADKTENKNKISFIKKFSSKLFGSDLRLASNPLVSYREVETELLSDLYKINTTKLDSINIDKKYLRYGNGACSDYELFANNLYSIKKVADDLTNIMKKAVKSDIYIMESFFNIFRSGSGITSHKHTSLFDDALGIANQKYSLTYYLSVGDQACSQPGILTLENPIKKILPSVGTIAIFPAGRKHSATYNGSIDRVMIGVNFYSLL